jgi:L-ribulose-5-phosphate 4-epimerase
MLEELKKECWQANMLLREQGLVPLTFGNASLIDRSRGIFAIKPSGVPYDVLKAEDMVLVDLDGNRVEGARNPSSDTPTHLQLYLGFQAINSVAHTHSRFATAFAQAGLEIPCLGTTHADYFHGPVPVTRAMTPAEIESGYETETGKVILERFRGVDPLAFPGVLVRNHGVFAWSAQGAKVAETTLVLELIAETAILSMQLNPGARPIDKALLDKHFLRKHGPKAYYGQPGGTV